MSTMNYKNVIKKIFIVLISLIMMLPTISSAVEITEDEEDGITNKVFIGTIDGMKVYNCYGSSKSIIIESHEGTEVKLQDIQAINVCKYEILALKRGSSEYVYKLARLNSQGKTIFEYKYAQIRSHALWHGDTFCFTEIGICMHLWKLDDGRWLQYHINSRIAPLPINHDHSIKGSMEHYKKFRDLRPYIAAVDENKLYYFANYNTYQIDDLKVYGGKLAELELFKETKYDETFVSYKAVKENITKDTVYNVQVYNGNVYYQKVEDNALYDIKEKLILDQITGIAIIYDDNIIYKNGDYLKVVELETPKNILYETKADYKLVHLERMPFGDILHVKDQDAIRYIPFETFLQQSLAKNTTE